MAAKIVLDRLLSPRKRALKESVFNTREVTRAVFADIQRYNYSCERWGCTFMAPRPKSELQRIEEQKHLQYTTERLVRSELHSKNLRAVTAFWREENHTACIYFYFHGPITEEDLEEASDICGGIIANFPNGLLEEKYILCDYPNPLPDQEFL